MSDYDKDRKRENRQRWKRIGVIGVLLPLIAASVLIWSATGRKAKLDKIPVAIVNNDTIVTEPQPMAAGRSLTATLTHPKTPSDNLKWTLTDTKEATDGLKDGTYYAVLTIPSDFSNSILSSGTDKPQRGQLKLVSNGAASTTMPYISEQIASASATSLGDQTTQGYLKNVYGGFNKIAQSQSKAADSATQLAGGTQQLTSGAAKLDDGAVALSGSLVEVATGTVELHAGTESVSTGAAKVQSGAAGVAQGARKLDAGAARLSDSSRTLARQSGVLASRSRAVAGGARAVSAGVRGVSTGSRLLSLEISALSDACAAQGGSAAFCDALAQSEDHARALAGVSWRVERGAIALAGASNQLAQGARALARGNAQVAGGANGLSNASDDLSRSTTKLLAGALSLTQGARGVDSAAGKLVGGTSSTSAAGASLASGSQTLASSTSQTNDGAQSLSSGLTKGAKQSPTYSSSQQDALAPVVSEPVQLTRQVQHTKHGNGWLIAAIIAVILWLAALVAALSSDLSGLVRNALAPVSSRRLALSQSVPIMGFAALQAAAVVVAVLVFHPSTAAVVPLALMTLLASLTFCFLALALRLGMGRVGITLFVLFLIVQLAASGNVIPLETAPGVLQRLNGVMPLTAFINGASQLVSGGHVASFFSVVLVLALWAVASSVAMVTVIRRKRTIRASSPGHFALGPA